MLKLLDLPKNLKRLFKKTWTNVTRYLKITPNILSGCSWHHKTLKHQIKRRNIHSCREELSGITLAAMAYCYRSGHTRLLETTSHDSDDVERAKRLGWDRQGDLQVNGLTMEKSFCRERPQNFWRRNFRSMPGIKLEN